MYYRIAKKLVQYVTIDTSKTHSNSFSLEVSTVTYCTSFFCYPIVHEKNMEKKFQERKSIIAK
jgi:hypothetical protein